HGTEENPQPRRAHRCRAHGCHPPPPSLHPGRTRRRRRHRHRADPARVRGGCPERVRHRARRPRRRRPRHRRRPRGDRRGRRAGSRRDRRGPRSAHPLLLRAAGRARHLHRDRGAARRAGHRGRAPLPHGQPAAGRPGRGRRPLERRMSTVGLWTLALAAAYTAFLVLANRRLALRPAGDRAASFFVDGRRFSAWTVAFCITGLFSGSSFISVLELSYLTGISALWYGVAETVQILLIALLLVKPLRERLVVTVTGIIGDRFGRIAKLVAGAITAITFPMWSVATTIAFASALHVFTNLSLPVSVAVTAVLLLLFLSAGGMQSVGFNQASIGLLFAVMSVVGVLALLSGPGRAALADLPLQRPDLLDPLATGPALILAWFGTFLVNVPLAQAAFQMSLSARTPEEGRSGMLRAAAVGAPFIVLGAIIGCAAAIAVPGGERGLVAVPRFFAEALPAPLVAVFFLGIWACALGWAGPCQFSGATSLGRDVGA